MSRMHTAPRQTGAALFTALMFLIVLTLISLAAMRTSTLELRMSGNQESKLAAFQSAQAIVDATMGLPANVKVYGDVGRRMCTGSDAGDTPDDIACDEYGVALAEDVYADELADGHVKVAVTRLSPLERPAPRVLGTSAAVFSVAAFQVDAAYDATDVGQSQSRIVEGVMVLVSKS